MKYTITIEPDFLRAELRAHAGGADIRAFLHAVFWAGVQHLRSNVVIEVRSAAPLFADSSDPDPLDVFPYVKRIAWYRTNRIALVQSASQVGLPVEKIEAGARARRINLRCFEDEATALRWFHDRRVQDRRRPLVQLRARVRAPKAVERRAEHSDAIPDRRNNMERRHEPRDPSRPPPVLAGL
jgi:hypothetical protein